MYKPFLRGDKRAASIALLIVCVKLLLTLGAHAQRASEGYSSRSVGLSVCLSTTILGL